MHTHTYTYVYIYIYIYIYIYTQLGDLEPWLRCGRRQGSDDFLAARGKDTTLNGNYKGCSGRDRCCPPKYSILDFR